jgi:uncharacterized protein
MSSISYTPTKIRIQLVDALRGFALAGIIILHCIQHFNFIEPATYNPGWLKPVDQVTELITALLFSGKAYAIFSILFGFSFWIQYSNQKARGNHFAGRFAWRMVLLFGFGMLHTLFYNGDILGFYAVFSVFLILTRKWSNKAVLLLACLFLLQPIEWIKWVYAFQDPTYHMVHNGRILDNLLTETRINGPFLKMMWLNSTTGQISNIGWLWEYGRTTQIPGCFLLGMLLARWNMFSERHTKHWLWIGGASIILQSVFFYLYSNPYPYWHELGHVEILYIIIWMYSGMTTTLIMLAMICLGWHSLSWFREAFALLAPYGRASLTNYISQSAFCTTLLFGYGFGLYPYLGASTSALMGILTFAAQVIISHWWLKRYKQGPLEWLWKKGTWIGTKKQRAEAPVTEAAQA